MTVDTLHPEYRNASDRWRLIRSIVNNTAQNYIHEPDKQDPNRTKQYRSDAILTNFTNLTKVGLTGLVFRKEPQITLPPELDYLEEDVTGTGIDFVQFSQHICGDVLQTGRYGILIDYFNEGKKAYLKPYAAESIINWKSSDVNGQCVLSLLVLRETIVREDEDIFCQETVEQYRVLRLVDGFYIQEIYNEKYELVDYIQPLDFKKNKLSFIPFKFIGSENNDWTVDYQPLYDLATVNLGHYRNSADYEESIFICGQPYLVINIGESSKEDFDNANPNGVAFGSRKALVVPSSGSAQLLQANANQLVAQAMKEKLEQAAAIGARLISPSGGRETAEAAKIRYGSQHSALYTLTTNISNAIEDCLEILCQFMGVDPELVEYELRDEFYDEIADANLIAQMILLSDRGIIAADDIREYGRRTGFILDSRTDEEIIAEAEIADPLA